MKKRFALFFAVIFILSSLPLASCGSGDGITTGSPDAVTTEGISEDTTRIVTEITTEEIAEITSVSTKVTAETTEKVTESISTESIVEEITTEETTPEETTEKETEEMITDVMIGEIIEAPYANDFSVSRVFGDDMVLQRGEFIRVWGFADESENGKKVSCEFKGMFAEALIENGEWCLTFTARLEADVNGADMKIYTDRKTVTIRDILVGDVYMVVGQSNVQYSMANLLTELNSVGEGREESIDGDAPIRLLMRNTDNTLGYPQGGTTEVCPDLIGDKTWTTANYDDVMRFSALGYYFAREIVERTGGNIPIGIIEMGFSGRPLGCFLPNEIAERFDTDYIDEATGLFVSRGVNGWPGTGRYVYNHHMYPFEKTAIAGLIWYQGESNNSYAEAEKYNATFSEYVKYMRATHNLINPDFPVFVVELPSIYQKPAGYEGDWHFMELGVIRAHLSSLPSVLENSYVAVSGDLWGNKDYYNSLHPLCKLEQATRLADLADAVIYGDKTMDEATGPILESVEISDDGLSAVLTFTNVGDGLKTSDGGEDVKGIVVFLKKYASLTCEAPASARITAKNQITVTHTRAMKGFAYNWESDDLYGETINLSNSFGNPAPAFITELEEFKLDKTHSYDEFEGLSSKKAKKISHSFDALMADGENFFTVGGIDSKLKAAGNTVTVKKGTERLSLVGWVGFKVEIIIFGYSVDGGDAIFESFPGVPEQAVKNAGGEYAQRLGIDVDISKLDVGEHTVTMLVLVDVDDGLALKLLEFTVVIE